VSGWMTKCISMCRSAPEGGIGELSQDFPEDANRDPDQTDRHGEGQDEVRHRPVADSAEEQAPAHAGSDVDVAAQVEGLRADGGRVGPRGLPCEVRGDEEVEEGGHAHDDTGVQRDVVRDFPAA
jgi:hypothetical protein